VRCGREEAIGKSWLDEQEQSIINTILQDKLMSLIYNIIDDLDTELLILKFLQAGIMDKGEFQLSKTGTPQGGKLSPF